MLLFRVLNIYYFLCFLIKQEEITLELWFSVVRRGISKEERELILDAGAVEGCLALNGLIGGNENRAAVLSNFAPNSDIL